MATFRRRGTSWRAELYKNGIRESATFPTKQQAVAWAQQREVDLVGARLPDKAVGDAFDRYEREVTPSHRGHRWESVRLALLGRDPLASVRLAALSRTDIADWRDRRLQSVSGASVRREMNLLQGVFKVARLEWGWLRDDPMEGVKRPSSPASRKRRISNDEIARMMMALGYDGGAPENASQRVALAFEFAVETAMRSGEILGLQWVDVSEKSVTLPMTKNGDLRKVPLSPRAREIIGLLPRNNDSVFGLESGVRDSLFRKARNRAGIENLHFHDSRAEAIWRMAKKLPLLDLARTIGHRDLKSLTIYYETDADALADLLG